MAQLPPSGNVAATHPANRAFFPALDGLRAVAFLMVFGQHYLALAWGWTGVNVFFVLSGFLITGILYDTRDAPYRVRNFYLRRTLRIFPLYYGLFLALLLLWPFVHWQWSGWWLLWPLYLGNFLRFLSPLAQLPGSALQMAADGHLRCALFPHSEIYLGHLWSLCVEEQFYLVWPWVVFWVRDRRRLLAICAAAVLLGPCLRFALQAFAPPWMLAGELPYRSTPAQADALLLGGLLALLWRGPARARLVTLARWAAGLGTVTLAGYFLFVLHGWRLAPGHYPPWLFTGGLLFADGYAAAVMVCALQPGSLTYRLLHRRALRWLGRLTYGAYVFHDLLHGLYVHLVQHTVGRALAWPQQEALTAVIALAGTLLLASLSFRFVESPFLAMKDRWTRP